MSGQFPAYCPRCQAPLALETVIAEREEYRVQCRSCLTTLALHFPYTEDGEKDPAMELGKVFDVPGYHLVGVLGRGGMGMVYSAVGRTSRQLIALKVLPPECAAHPELVMRFDMEAQMMATLNHPNIVSILDRGRVGPHFFLVMQFIPGKTLKDRIREAAPLPIEEVLAIATPISEAIQTCHDNGLIHRDLKPANVLLGQDGGVYVTDFGIANLLRALGERTESGVMIGTPQYIAPEQLRDGSQINVRADQYSLAVIIYEMLTGSLPMGVFEPPSRSCPEVTQEAEASLLKALSRDSRNRYDSLRQFMRAFRRSMSRASNAPPSQEIVRVAAAPSPTPMASSQRASPILDVLSPYLRPQPSKRDIMAEAPPPKTPPPEEVTPAPNSPVPRPIDEDQVRRLEEQLRARSRAEGMLPVLVVVVVLLLAVIAFMLYLGMSAR